jgi:restriction endonuclease S subunit
LFYKHTFPYEKGMINEHVFILRTIESQTQKYLFSLLFSNKGQEILKLNVTGTAQGGLNRENLLNIQVPLPPLEIQSQIVAEIEVLEEKEKMVVGEIEGLKAQINSFFESNTFKEAQTLKLGEICEMKAGKFVSPADISSKFEDGFYSCYGGNGFRGYTKTFSHEGDFSLVGRQGALCGNVCFVSGKFHATEHAVVVKPFSNIENRWLYYELIHLNLNQYATGTAQPGLSVQNLNSVSVLVPSLQEQQKIVSEIEKLESRIIALETELKAIPQQKEAILKKYL